jgi:hypothetical protein
VTKIRQQRHFGATNLQVPPRYLLTNFRNYGSVENWTRSDPGMPFRMLPLQWRFAIIGG